MAATHSHRRLIINADDFGLSPGVSAGIVEAIEAGGVTSTSMIVNLDDFEDSLGRLREHGGLSVGLHFNITVGRALTRARSLTDRRGIFRGFSAQMLRASVGLIDSGELALECVAQIDKMTEAGVVPTHIDSHRHVHMHPALFRVVAHAAALRGVPAIRVATEPLATNPWGLAPTAKKIGLRAAARMVGANRARWAPDHFFGLSLQGGRDFAPRLHALIARLPSGVTEIMVHPGRVDPDLSVRDGYTWQRERELTALLSSELRDHIARSGIEQIGFRELASA
ncbi:MAG: ChbG/HpnK family deacetylase [Gemmatimonadaceae bacterium]